MLVRMVEGYGVSVVAGAGSGDGGGVVVGVFVDNLIVVAALAVSSPPSASSLILSAFRRRIRCRRNGRAGWGRSPCW